MTRDEFLQLLNEEGFAEPMEVTWDSHKHNDTHAHEFTARGLILKGSMRLTHAGSERDCRVGDVFHVRAGEPHIEQVGSEGVKILVGRK